MKTTLLDIDKKTIFSQFLENSLNDSNVSFAWVFGVDKDVIKVNNDKNMKFVGHDFVNIALETGRCIGQPKRHYSVHEVPVSSPENRLPFIALFYPHPIINTREVELGELFCLI